MVHFAAFKKHIGFYPTPTGIEQFKKELSGYKGAKGSVQFPLDKPVPFDLIDRIVKFRVKENLERAKAKGEKKSVAEAAELCKVDLLTEMVREFPTLQGVVGGLYAREEGFFANVHK